MVSYGALAQGIKRGLLVVVGGVGVLYIASGYIQKAPVAPSPVPKQALVQESYDVVARYLDKNKSITEHVVFYAPKHENSLEKIARNAILVRRPRAKSTILMCHGFGCSKRDISFLRLLFPEHNIMMFDFRAHGQETDGQYCTLGRDEAHDVIAAAQFIKEYDKTKDLPLLLYGFSMGAVSAIEAQAKEPSLFKAMILDCPFDSVQNIIRRGLEHFKISVFGYEIPLPGRSLLEKCAFNKYTQPIVQFILKLIAGIDAQTTPVAIYHVHPEESIKKITVPCFFIICKNDEKVPLSAMKTMFENAGTEYKQLWVTGGRRHFDSFFHEPDRYLRKVQRFFDRILRDAYDEVVKGKIVDDSAHPRSEVF